MRWSKDRPEVAALVRRLEGVLGPELKACESWEGKLEEIERLGTAREAQYALAHTRLTDIPAGTKATHVFFAALGRVAALRRRGLTGRALELEAALVEKSTARMEDVDDWARKGRASAGPSGTNSPQTEQAKAKAAAVLEETRVARLLVDAFAQLTPEELAVLDRRALSIAEEVCKVQGAWRPSAVSLEAARKREELLRIERPDLVERALAGEFIPKPVTDPKRVLAWLALAKGSGERPPESPLVREDLAERETSDRAFEERKKLKAWREAQAAEARPDFAAFVLGVLADGTPPAVVTP